MMGNSFIEKLLKLFLQCALLTVVYLSNCFKGWYSQHLDQNKFMVR